jgi:hypothetical protein
MNNALLHAMNRTHTFIDVESGQLISLPKDETDKPPVNADVNGLQFFGKTTQDGEPAPDNPVDLVSIPPEFNVSVCGKNLVDLTKGLNRVLTVNNGVYKIEKQSDGARFSARIPLYIPANTTFTLSANIHSTNVVYWRKLECQFEFSDGTATSGGLTRTFGFDSYTNSFTKTIKTIRFYIVDTEDAGAYCSFDNLQIEIGSVATPYQPFVPDSPSSEYPSDVKSAPAEFNVSVCGKNLYNHRNNNIANGSIEIIDDYVRCTGNNADANDFHFSRGWYRPRPTSAEEYNQPILKNGDVVTISADVRLIEQRNTPGVRIYLYSYSNNDGHTSAQTKSLTLNTWVRVSQSYTITSTFLVGKDDYYPIFTLNGNIVDIKNIAIKYGTDDTYTPYTGNTYPYRLEDLDGNLYELCSLPDGTRDEYDRDNGILIKRVKRLTVTSGTTSEPINLQAQYWTSSADSPTFIIHWNDTTNRWQSALGRSYNLRCNIAKPGDGEFKCSVDLRTNDTMPRIIYPKELFISQGYTLDVNGVRQYINDIITANGKPITFLYPRAEPQIIPLKKYDPISFPYNQKPKSIQYHTNIFTDVGVEMQCEVRKLGNRKMGEFYWVTENGDKIITEDGDYIMLEY